MNPRKKVLLTLLVLAMMMILWTTGSYRTVAAQNDGKVFWGTWAMAMDTGIFGIPDGVFPAVWTIHRDGTLIVTDGGDLGSVPFTTADTAQQGVWVQVSQQTFMSTTLSLQKNEMTGQAEGWHRGRFNVQFAEDSDHLVGFVEDEFLPCNPGPTFAKLLNCPDPITSAYQPAPFPIPIKLTRLRVN